MNRVYFDNSASTPVDPVVMSTYVDNYVDNFGNPSSVHSFGQKARADIERARMVFAEALSCSSQEIIFCGSATEANNIAISGVISSYRSKFRPHILISAIEHASVADFVHHPDADVEVFGVLPNGVADIEDIFAKIRPETVLISLMMVNNEIGTIQPIPEVAKKFRKINETRENKVLFHTDAVQGVLWLPINMDGYSCDFLTLSSHKMYAPKGAAVLYVNKKVVISKTIFGGGQEKGLRSGTQNTQAIVAFAKAMEMKGVNYLQDLVHVREMQNYIMDFVAENIPDAILNGDEFYRTANNVHYTFPGFDQDVLLTKLDLAGFAVSAGSSCSSGVNEPSHIPKLLHPEISGADLRITLGKQNKMEEVDSFCIALKQILIK
jgi:cysteine desulfurase